jgi:PQQ-like domain
MRRKLLLLVAALALTCSACDWPFVGANLQRTAFDVTNTKVSGANVSGLRLLYTASVDGVPTSPVVSHGDVYVSSENDATFTVTISAFDGTGARNCGGTPRACTPLWAHSATTPGGLAAPSNISAPGVGNSTVYVGITKPSADEFSGTTYAYDAASGAPGTGGGQGPTDAPLRDGGLLYTTWQFTCCFGSTYAGVQAVDASTGSVVFGDLTNGQSEGPSPAGIAVAGGVIYATGDFVPSPGAGAYQLRAIDAAGKTNCAPFSQNIGIFPPVTCTPLWSATPPAELDTEPAVANGDVYAGGTDGNLYVYAAGGCGRATCTPLWTAHTGAAIKASVAVTGDTALVASTDGHLYAFPAKGCGHSTCTPRWTAPIAAGDLSSPSIGGQLVYLGEHNGGVDAFALGGCGAATCSSLWHGTTAAAVDTAPALVNGRVYVADAGGTLSVFALPPGS